MKRRYLVQFVESDQDRLSPALTDFIAIRAESMEDAAALAVPKARGKYATLTEFWAMVVPPWTKWHDTGIPVTVHGFKLKVERGVKKDKELIATA